MKYFIFAQNILKQYVKIFYKINFLIINKSVYQVFNINNKVILQLFCEKICNKYFSSYIII